MNIFDVLGLRYEVFFSRMLLWLWNTKENHMGNDIFWKPIRGMIGLPDDESVISIKNEVRTPNSMTNRWRLADLVVQTSTTFILIEIKVDPLYQDVQQIRDEVQGGVALAQEAKRKFIFVYIAPGPLANEVASEIEAVNGIFISWATLTTYLRSVPFYELDAAVVSIIRQFIEYAEVIAKPGGNKPSGDPILRESDSAIVGLLKEYPIGGTLTAIEVWSRFMEEYPDHVNALDSRYADSSHYSAKSWFSAKLQRMAANRDLIEDSGHWTSDIPSNWGFNKVRVYRRLPESN